MITPCVHSSVFGLAPLGLAAGVAFAGDAPANKPHDLGVVQSPRFMAQETSGKTGMRHSIFEQRYL
jgi:hypothetical protein